MKKIIICSVLIAAGVFSAINLKNSPDTPTPDFGFKNVYSIVLEYDKSMSEKTIKAAVIDSYFREVAANGKIIRWNKSMFPLKVYIQDSPDVPGYYREIVMSAYQAWQRASEGLVTFDFVETPEEAQMKCYFKNVNNQTTIGAQSFSVNGNVIKESTIVFK